MTGAYNSERWKQNRRAALARDKVCQDCGTSDKLHVHHIRPVSSFDHSNDAHYLDNLVVLCASCHPKWEGENKCPNLLNREYDLHLSELVHDLSRDAISREMPPPGEYELYEYIREYFLDERFRCDECFASLTVSRGRDRPCDNCGRPPKYWKGRNHPPDESELAGRIEDLCRHVSKTGVNIHTGAAKAAASKLWKKDKHYGDVETVTSMAVRIGLRKADNTACEVYDAVCPVPRPYPELRI